MSKTTKSSVAISYDHIPTFDRQWNACIASHATISALVGAETTEIEGWADEPESRRTLKFWLVVQVLRESHHLCRDGVACHTFTGVLRFLRDYQDRFQGVLAALSLSEDEFFDLLIANENLVEEELAAFDVFAEKVRSEDEPLQFVIALMTHLKPASEIANACNGHTSRVIELLQREDQEVLEPLRALLCPQK